MIPNKHKLDSFPPHQAGISGILIQVELLRIPESHEVKTDVLEADAPADKSVPVSTSPVVKNHGRHGMSHTQRIGQGGGGKGHGPGRLQPLGT